MKQLSHNRLFTVVLFGLIAFVFTGCRKEPSPQLPPAVQQAQSASASVEQRLLDANMDFAFDLFQSQIKANAQENILLSPTSIALALHIVYNGARGETQKAMERTLKLKGLSLKEINTANAALQAQLLGENEIQLTIANGLWFNANSVLPDFVKMNTEYYGSELGGIGEVPDGVNRWAQQKTNGKIKSIMPPNSPNNIATVIANAVYFKANWSSKFNPQNTRKAPFYSPQNNNLSILMMKQKERFDYMEEAGFTAIRLPYGTNQKYRLVILLPYKEKKLADLYPLLTTDNWTKWSKNFTAMEVEVQIPRQTSTYSSTLNDTLSRLGMDDALHSSANFGGIGANIYLDKSLHSTAIEMNEEGSEASAASIEMLTVGAKAPPKPKILRFIADHPFIYLIEHTETKSILFLGQLVNPK
jgi:serpin B